ncbi:MAG: hypothetical protein AMXMBFR23_01190 [Chloroflexota bacterium]
MGTPATGCSTFGTAERIRVPGPAASTIAVHPSSEATAFVIGAEMGATPFWRGVMGVAVSPVVAGRRN